MHDARPEKQEQLGALVRGALGFIAGAILGRLPELTMFPVSALLLFARIDPFNSAYADARTGGIKFMEGNIMI